MKAALKPRHFEMGCACPKQGLSLLCTVLMLHTQVLDLHNIWVIVRFIVYEIDSESVFECASGRFDCFPPCGLMIPVRPVHVEMLLVAF